MNYIVEMRHITKRFPGIIANDDISLQIKKGEIFAILGENGAGKSTLMSILFGMYEPDEGEIFIRGETVLLRSPNHAASLKIGMVHQHFMLVSDYTVAENIVLGQEPVRKIFGMLPVLDKKRAKADIEALSVKYGLEVNPGVLIRDCNVSTQQRVEILKMLYREADILILDEPTAVLTPQEVLFLLEIIRNLRDAGKTIILITHKLEEIKQIADRCAILNRGKLVSVLRMADTSTSEIAKLMVGREIVFGNKIKNSEKTEEHGRTILKLESVCVYDREEFPILKNVNLEIHAGEILAIAGVAGNGQVELAEVVAGLKTVSEGKIMLRDRDITRFSIRQRTDLGISYIPEDRQNDGLVLDFTLTENMGLRNYYKEPYCKRGILYHKLFQKKAEALISAYDIRSSRGSATVVRSMSGGNQQKAIIAREIEQDADLLIFVQPTRGLDIGAIDRIHRQMIAERNKGKAILLISLDMDEIRNCADTIAVIYKGEIQTVRTAEEITTEQIGSYMMGLKKEVQ